MVYTLKKHIFLTVYTNNNSGWNILGNSKSKEYTNFSNSIYDLYQLQENIGTGNFSTVFRGK